MNFGEIRQALKNDDYVKQNTFHLLKNITNFYNNDTTDKRKSQELILCALEKKSLFVQESGLLTALVREIGLFPYLNPEDLSIRDRIAYYSHLSPIPAKKEIIFHREQAHIFYLLMSGKSIVLSAPTSFGKSLIIDAILSTKKYDNIVLIVPTIALIEETRKRLTKFKDYYNLITHTFQDKKERNVFIITQERCMEEGFIENVDFFIIDEFYKLSPFNNEDERCDLLNSAFYYLHKNCKHFYMLGPNIDGITSDFKENVEFVFIHLDYPTVVAEYYDFYGSRKNSDKIIDILPQLNDSSLFFCKSPNSAMDLAKFMAERVPENQTEIVSEFCNWISKNYHAEWILIDILKHSIGVHHARIPRAVANFILYLFNKKHIKYLVCTSTLIEGVNTVAKNVVLYDNRINTKKIDYFTFNNIVGRSGRMFEHFIGNVYLLQPPPEKELPIVDLPIYSQDENTAKSLLLNVDESDLKESSRLKMKAIYENGMISLTTLRKNMGVDPELQIEFAKDLNTNYLSWHPFLYWSRKPSYDQLKFICNKIWNSFNGSNLGSGSVISSEQLTYMIFNLKGKFKESLDAYLRPTYNIDNAISKVLDFRKLWAGFHFPRLLITINNIQEEIYTKRGMPCGSYAFYAKEIENYCLPANMIALEEYGLPAEISMTLRSLVNFDGTFEEVISRMKKIDANRLRNDRIERFIFKLFQKYI